MRPYRLGLWIAISVGAIGGCLIATLLASNGVALPASLALGGAFAMSYSMLASRRPFWRVFGSTATGGCAFAAGLAANGTMSVLKAVAAGGLLWICLLGILSLVLFARGAAGAPAQDAAP